MTEIRQILITVIAAMLLNALPLGASETPDSTITVSLLTCYPGNEIYELEGHTGLRIHGTDTDITVNWGLYNFNAPNFVYRFVKGETDYMCGAIPTPLFLNEYRKQGRKVLEQVIDLTPEETERLIALINDNLLPQNRTYRYNYVKDNCATRPLLLIEQAIADTLSFTGRPLTVGTATTFREVMTHYHRNYPWYQFGIDLVLGSGIDHPLSTREYAFAPHALAQMMHTALRKNTAGSEPLVSQSVVLSEGPDEGTVMLPTPWYLTPVAVFWTLAVLIALATLFDVAREKVTRWIDAVLYGALGLAGCLVAFLVFVSVHEATSPNWVILWAEPLCLLVPVTIWLKKCNRLLMSFHFINFVAIMAYAVIWIAGIQHGNPAFIPLLLCDAMRSSSYIYISRCDIRRRKKRSCPIRFYAR